MDVIDQKLLSLSKSKFRSSFKLRKKEIDYINEKGMDTIKRHAYEIIEKRLKPSNISNDGKQTPMKNHPVFIAQHACACCCRGCLNKWYKIDINRELTDREVDFIVAILLRWIENQYKMNNTVLQ